VKNGGKVIIGALGVLGLFWLLKRSGSVGSGLSVGIYDQSGELLGSVSEEESRSGIAAAITTLMEGNSYIVKATVTNNSKKGTVPIEASLLTYLTVSTEMNSVVTGQMQLPADGTNVYAPGASKLTTWPAFTIPVSPATAGYTGTVIVEVKIPAGTTLAIKSVSIPIVIISPTWAATITPPET
jgi:hypothetical protein